MAQGYVNEDYMFLEHDNYKNGWVALSIYLCIKESTEESSQYYLLIVFFANNKIM